MAAELSPRTSLLPVPGVESTLPSTPLPKPTIFNNGGNGEEVEAADGYKPAVVIPGENAAKTHVVPLIAGVSSISSDTGDGQEHHEESEYGHSIERRRAIFKKSKALSSKDQVFLTATDIDAEHTGSSSTQNSFRGIPLHRRISQREIQKENQMKERKIKDLGPLVYPKEFPKPKSKSHRKDNEVAGEQFVINRSSNHHGVHLSKRTNGLPGGLSFSSQEANKYFGDNARDDFYDRYHWLSSQRIKASVDMTAPTTVLTFPLSSTGSKQSMEKLQGRSERAPSLSDYGFAPTRQEAPTKVNTKVLIRTQSLAPEAQFEQMKLIAKPEHVQLPTVYQSDSESSVSDSEEDEEQVQEENDKKLLQMKKSPSSSPRHQSQHTTGGFQVSNEITPRKGQTSGISSPSPIITVTPTHKTLEAHKQATNSHELLNDPRIAGKPRLVRRPTADSSTVLSSARYSSEPDTTGMTPLQRTLALNNKEAMLVMQQQQQEQQERQEMLVKVSKETVKEAELDRIKSKTTSVGESILAKLNAAEKGQMKSLRAQVNREIKNNSASTPTAGKGHMSSSQAMHNTLPTMTALHMNQASDGAFSKPAALSPHEPSGAAIKSPIPGANRLDTATTDPPTTAGGALMAPKRKGNGSRGDGAVAAGRRPPRNTKVAAGNGIKGGPSREGTEKRNSRTAPAGAVRRKGSKPTTADVGNSRPNSRGGTRLEKPSSPGAKDWLDEDDLSEAGEARKGTIGRVAFLGVKAIAALNATLRKEQDEDSVDSIEEDNDTNSSNGLTPLQRILQGSQLLQQSQKKIEVKKPESASVVTDAVTPSDALSPEIEQRNKKYEEAFKSKVIAPLQLICIDHRDKLNRRVTDRLAKNNLFKYVEAKQANLDFYDNIDSDDSDEDHLLELDELIHSPHIDVPTPLQQQGGKQSDAPLDSSRRSIGSQYSMGSSVGSLQTYNTQELIEIQGNISPRSQFIDSCIRKNLNPRASLLLRKQFTKKLQLQHHGMGDKIAKLFARAIVGVPHIMSFNVADNNLTDAGLGPIVKAVMRMSDIVDLDLSYNTIGPVAASCLALYLAREDCPLERLVLRRADVDDGECERFVSALKSNRNLKDLDLAENLIGSSENLNTVMPDLMTGGEALADLLRHENCTLKSLRLGWNMIRLDGAVDLCSSLKINKTLTYLDVSFNSLGSTGGRVLGDALQDNKVLKELNVSNNSIDAVACMTICSGILENEALKAVSFDGNPIGEQGAKALMLLPSVVGSRVRISATGCNIRIRDSECWFDSSMLIRRYNLKLDDPFHRSVALMLMFLVAAHQTYIIAHSEYYDDETRQTIDLELTEQSFIDEGNRRLTPLQLESIENLKIIKNASNDVETAVMLFGEIDEDNSGQLDEQEFGNLLASMGMQLTPSQVREKMSEYDVDQGGVIELSEFILFLRAQAKEAEQKLKELTEFPIIVQKGFNERYIPPRHGELQITVIDGFTHKDTYRVLTASDRGYIVELARASGEILQMTYYGVQNYKIHLDGAMAIVDTMMKENSNKTQVLSKVLPQVASAPEARALVNKVLGNNKTEVQRLRREIGYALKPMLGSLNGHYILDLSQDMDKFCLNRLLEYSMTIGHGRAKKCKLGYGIAGDCSQKGNWSGFRNELFNNRPVIITTDFASPMPKSGRLEFDFVSEKRFNSDDFVLSDVRFTNMLARLFLIRTNERDAAVERLKISRKNSERTLQGDAKTIYEVNRERSDEIGEAMYEFYEQLRARHESCERLRMKEGIKVTMEIDPLVTILTYKNVENYYNIPSILDLPPEVPYSAKPKSDSKKPSRSGSSSSGKLQRAASSAVAAVEGKGNKTSNSSMNSNKMNENSSKQDLRRDAMINSTKAEQHATQVVNKLTEGIELDEYMRRYVCAIASSNVHQRAKAARTLELLVDAFEFHYIMARHLELLCLLFDECGQIKTSEYWGTYRVEMVIALFSCVVDLHNFEIVMRALTPFEAACVICRLGWLHIYNPMKPEGHFQLDMSRREERVIVKTLAQLATAEPGDNLPFVQFRWERDMDPMPGYELTEPWLTEDGLPRKGIWDCHYYAGEGTGQNGCKPYTRLRRALLQLVLINEEEIKKEVDRDDLTPRPGNPSGVTSSAKDSVTKNDDDGNMLAGETFMMANSGIFYSYLAYNEEQYKKYMERKQAAEAAANKENGRRAKRK